MTNVIPGGAMPFFTSPLHAEKAFFRPCRCGQRRCFSRVVCDILNNIPFRMFGLRVDWLDWRLSHAFSKSSCGFLLSRRPHAAFPAFRRGCCSSPFLPSCFQSGISKATSGVLRHLVRETTWLWAEGAGALAGKGGQGRRAGAARVRAQGS